MKRRKTDKGSAAMKIVTSDRGIALLMVLWIVIILMVIALSFSFMTRTDTHATLFFKEGSEKQFLAEAGIERAIMEMFYRTYVKSLPSVPMGSEEIKVDGTEYQGRLGADYYVYGIVDESGKINLNLLTDTSGIILGNLLTNRGVPKEVADTIVDSVLDWMDSDETHRLQGAESDYYMSLPVPYKAKNDKFEALEELLLIKGMTPEILYGTAKTPGIINFLTVYSKTGGINVNTAPREVLAALPGMTPEMAEQIVGLRASGEIKDLEAVKQVMGEGFKTMSTYVGLSESNLYTIESTGFKKGESQGLSIRAIVDIQGNGKYRYVYYKNPAGSKPWQEPKL
jgi:general secretion pathway protein K